MFVVNIPARPGLAFRKLRRASMDALRLAKSIEDYVETARNETHTARSYATSNGSYVYSKLGHAQNNLNNALSDLSRLIRMLKG